MVKLYKVYYIQQYTHAIYYYNITQYLMEITISCFVNTVSKQN